MSSPNLPQNTKTNNNDKKNVHNNIIFFFFKHCFMTDQSRARVQKTRPDWQQQRQKQLTTTEATEATEATIATTTTTSKGNSNNNDSSCGKTTTAVTTATTTATTTNLKNCDAFRRCPPKAWLPAFVRFMADILDILQSSLCTSYHSSCCFFGTRISVTSNKKNTKGRGEGGSKEGERREGGKRGGGCGEDDTRSNLNISMYEVSWS